MADKEAWVFIVDVGATMANCNGGRVESDLDWGMRYVWDKISHIVSLNRKGIAVGVLGLRTNETNNAMENDEGYENISILQELQAITMDHVRSLRKQIQPTSQINGDAISAIVLAVDMMEKFTKKLKYTRKIVLITDALSLMDNSNLDRIAEQINETNIQLIILGVDFDDLEYGFKEEDKPSLKEQNETTLKTLASYCKNGTCASLGEAIEELDIPNVKTTRPYKTFEGRLTLGNPDSNAPFVDMAVERYFKTKTASPASASTVVLKKEEETGATDMMEFSAVKQARSYKVDDASVPGGKRYVEFESLAKGYEYGRTAVYISESEFNITKIETTKSMSIIGFIEKDKFKQVLNMGESCVTVPNKFDAKSQMAFSAFIHALEETSAYAVARLVAKDSKEPLVVLLVPDVVEGCLYDITLPFAEDVRSYQFPPLDKVLTVTGTTVKEHRNLPDDALQQTMSDYVDAMDISEYGVDPDGNSAEYISIDETFNPIIHRIKQAIQDRAIHPDHPVPPIPPPLLRFSKPSEDLVQSARYQIDALIDTAEVKKVPPKVKSKKRQDVKPVSGLDIDALFGLSSSGADESSKKKASITSDNAIPDYKRAIQSAIPNLIKEEGSEEDAQEKEVDYDLIEDATKQIDQIIRNLISSGFGDSHDEQVIEHVGAVREELLAISEPATYNKFLQQLKTSLLSGELGGDRRELWFRLVRIARLGLITDDQCAGSGISLDEAKEFFYSRP